MYITPIEFGKIELPRFIYDYFHNELAINPNTNRLCHLQVMRKLTCYVPYRTLTLDDFYVHENVMINQMAYFYWNIEGKPAGKDKEHWSKAEEDYKSTIGAFSETKEVKFYDWLGTYQVIDCVHLDGKEICQGVRVGV